MILTCFAIDFNVMEVSPYSVFEYVVTVVMIVLYHLMKFKAYKL